MSALLVVEQRRGRDDAAHWVREGERRLPGLDGNRRIAEVREGLLRHAGARRLLADASDEEVERTLGAIHDAVYLAALAEIDSHEPVVLPGFAPPGLEPDIPVDARLVAAAREAVRAAVSAARHLAGGERFAYAVCRPPGHHAGPAFQAGYCYLNNAAAAVRALVDAGIAPVGVLDLDLHYPNGTSAILERIGEATLHSLHAEPVTNLPPGAELPRAEDERTVSFPGSPDAERYLAEVATSVAGLAERGEALVVSLGFDTVRGDPHGGWDFEPALFAELGAQLAAAGLPVCVVQEGGYALGSLAACAESFAAGLLAAAPRAVAI